MGTRGVLLSIAVLAGCGAEKNTHLRVRVAPHVWTSMDVCSHGEFTIYVQTESGATVRIPGVVEEKVIGDNHAIDLPADKLGDRTSLTLTAELDGRRGETTFEIPKPPPRQGKVEGVRQPSGGVIGGEGTVTYAARDGSEPVKQTISVNGVVDAGELTFTYTGCLLASGKTDFGTIEVRSPTELVHRIPLDAAIEKAGARDEYGSRPLGINLALTNADGVTADVFIDGSLAVDALERDRFAANREGGALAWAPAYEPGKQQPYAQFVDAAQPVVKRGAAAQVAAVAWSTYTSTRPVEGCGPYTPPGGWEKTYLDREVHDELVTIREAKTGAVIAEKAFKGVVPRCPTSMLKGGPLETTKVSGGASAKAMLAWIEATVR